MDMRTVSWDYEKQELMLIDQRKLPSVLEILHIKSCEETGQAIRIMAVRGAPAIGAAAAFGLALVAQNSQAKSPKELLGELREAADGLLSSRPTAVNLKWALGRMLARAERKAAHSSAMHEMKVSVLDEAQKIADEDVQTNKRMAEYGASLVDDGDTIIHHCNTGALAAVDWGTALGAIRLAWEKGKRVHVLVDETRPRLQGARLTAWELEQYGIPYEIITDNMAGYFLASGRVKKVFFGADRIAMNGDVANKVGTYMLALAAKDNGVPVYSVAPTTTIDWEIPGGDRIPIEMRDAEEVLDIQLHGERVTPKGARAVNPAFDVTPGRLLTAIVTEGGIIVPPFTVNLGKLRVQFEAKQ